MSADFFKNFEVAFKKLKEFSEQELKDDLDKAGLIQGFEFTFEQSWKAIQKAAGHEGINVISPKSAYSWAMEKGWIKNSDEQIWLDMLLDRNLTSQTYREAVAQKVIQNIKAVYVHALGQLLQNMKS